MGLCGTTPGPGKREEEAESREKKGPVSRHEEAFFVAFLCLSFLTATTTTCVRVPEAEERRGHARQARRALDTDRVPKWPARREHRPNGGQEGVGAAWDSVTRGCPARRASRSRTADRSGQREETTAPGDPHGC